MSTTDPTPQNGTDSTDTITDLRDLRVGDRVVFGGRSQPVDVVEVGTRTVTDERITKAIETPVVRVQGDWSGAVDRVLAHKLQRWADGIVLEETDAIVACEDDSLERGEQVTVRRVSRSEEVDVRTDGGRSAGNPETRLGEARKQLRILLDDVEFEDEDTAEYVAGALACAESAAVCLEGPEVLEDRSGGSDA